MRSPRVVRRSVVALLAIGLATPGLMSQAAVASEYVQAPIGEIPTAVAVSDTGVIAAGLYDARAIALVAPDGTVRRATLDCSPVDVEIAPDGATAWAVCQESEHLSVIDTASLDVASASMDVIGLDSIVYLPAVDELVIGSLEGWVLAVSEVSTDVYLVRMRSEFSKDGPHRVTQVAPLSGGGGAYAITDGGDLLYADLEFGGQSAVIRRSTSDRSFQSIALGPFDTALYAAVVDYSSPATVTLVEIVDMATGAARQSVPVEVAGGAFSTMDLAAGYRLLTMTTGVGADTPTGSSGLLEIPVDDEGALGGVQSASVTASSGAGTAMSADYTRVAFGTTDARALGITVDDTPYPAAIRVVATAKGAKLTITGTTTSLRPLTGVTVYIKDLTKKKTTFKKQSKRAVVNYQGDIAWSGKAPSKRFAVYLSGGGAKSKTVTVKRR